ncbi:hypothetical protein [Psychrobacillus vulpis]|uniref:Uncharacterized protein n=1 Tax=Psychrobacillus vulpis TaxID=2325572 RepID=A0A544TGL3_9BACI|nr:hypothetical protein [Psychrobacillus vulpis]TQR16592.1 hypothetical protein FG384_18495 [Psychrobacillus vulpis]
MRELEKRLKKELQQNRNVKIMDTAKWGIPVHTIEVEYQTVKRNKMDVLMKMMLIAFQKTDIAKAEDLSELLLVEQLFIQDLIDVLLRTQLIEKVDDFYKLTSRGYEQFKNGVFEEEQEVESQNIMYSSCHQLFLDGEINTALTDEEELVLFQYVKSENTVEHTFEDSMVINALKNNYVESDEGDSQMVVSNVLSTTELHMDKIPCLQFILYNTEEDIMYARVWNSLIERWDEKLENQLNENERIKWRETYL